MFDHVVIGASDYAASKVIGPDGHNIEVVCHQPEG
jgi:hypothetical protein